MTKIRVSATIDPATDDLLEGILKKGKYRNKSHILEEAIEHFAKEGKHDK